MNTDVVVVGGVVEFVYNGKARKGTIDKTGIGPAGQYFTLQMADGSFKSFTVSKCSPVK